MESKSITINEIMVAGLAEKGLLKQFSVFLQIKTLYRNGCIYNYTQKGLAAKSGLALSKIRKNVPEFLRLGWCRLHHGNLIFNDFDQVYNKRGSKWVFTKLTITKNLKELYQSLCRLVLKVKQAQFELLKTLETKKAKSSSERERRTINKLLDRLNIRELPNEKSMYKVSMKGIAKNLGVSVGSAQAIISGLRTRGEIHCFANRTVIRTGYNKGAIAAALEYGGYYNNGAVIINECNSYVF